MATIQEAEAQQLKMAREQGGGTVYGINSVWKVQASQEYKDKEAKESIEKEAGEKVTQVQETRSESGQLLSRHYRGESGKVYKYNFGSGELTSFGGESERIQVDSGNKLIPITLSPAVTEKVGGSQGLQRLLMKQELEYNAPIMQSNVENQARYFTERVTGIAVNQVSLGIQTTALSHIAAAHPIGFEAVSAYSLYAGTDYLAGKLSRGEQITAFEFVLSSAAIAGGAIGLKYGWDPALRSAVKWSNVKWDDPIISKKATIGSRDIKEIVVDGKVYDRLIYEGSSSSQYTQHGVSKAWRGLLKKDIYSTGFPETEFSTLVGGKNTYATTWNPAVTVERISLGRFVVKESLFYPTSFSKSVSFPMAVPTKVIATGDGFLGKGSFSSPDLTGEIKQFGSISENAVFSGFDISKGYSYSVTTPTLISSVSKEVIPTTKDLVMKTDKGGTVVYPSFDSRDPTEIDVKSIYDVTGKSFSFKQIDSGAYSFSPIKTIEKSLVVSREPIIFLGSGGGRGSVSMTKPPDSAMFGGSGSGSVFDNAGLQTSILKQFDQTLLTGAVGVFGSRGSGKAFNDPQYTVYPPSVKNVITTNVKNQQMSIQKTSLGNQAQLQLGLQSQMPQQSQLQQSLQSSMNLSSTIQQTQLQQVQLQQVQLRHLNLNQQTIQQQDLQQFSSPQSFNIPHLTGSGSGTSAKIFVESPFKKTKVLNVTKLTLPTASLESLERSFSRFGSGSLARGTGIENVFRNLARSSGISLEFPAAEFIKGSRKKKRRKRK